MTLTAKAAFSGLMTAVAETLAPAGALRKADNVVIRKSGIVEPRQAFQPVTIGYDASGLTLINAATLGSSTIYENGTAWKNVSNISLQTVTEDGSTITPARLRADRFATAKSRGNLYFPTSKGLLKLSAPSDSAWGRTGEPVHYLSVQPGQLFAMGSGTGLASGFQWAYRMVYCRKDSNGLIVKSRPTGAFVVKNTTGGASSVYISVIALNLSSTDLVEIYRTRAFPNSVQFDDEMALVCTADAAGFSGVQFIFIDSIADDKRGQSLYTSPSREGIESSNDRAPAASVCETYRGCLFLGDIIGPQRTIFSHAWSSSSIAGAAGVGVRIRTGTLTSGSPAITSVSSTTGLQVGMCIESVAPSGGVAYFSTSPPARIVSIVGSTVTMSANALANGTPGTIDFLDAIEINGNWAPAYPQNAYQYMLYLALAGSSVGAYEITPPQPGYESTVVVESILPNSSAFTIRATHGNEYSPPLPLAGATAKNSTADAYPNGLVWSKPDEPEHFPPRDFGLIAEKTKAMLGLCATRDSLFIFKEDGIFRLSGVGGEWQIDPFDLTTFCVLPSSIRRLDNRIYMLSNKGVVSVDETGVTVVSTPVYDQVAKLVDDARSNFVALGYYKLTGLTGVAATVDDRNFEYLLHVGTNALDCGGNVLVFNAQSGAWTTFSFKSTGFAGYAVSGLGVDAVGNPLLLHTAGARASSYSIIALGSEIVPTRADQSAAITVSSVAPGDAEATVTYSPATSLVVGDVLACSNGYFAVTGVTSSTVVTVAAAFAMPATGGGTAYRSMTCTVQPHAFSAPQLAAKKWTHAVWALSRFVGALTASALFSSATVNLDQASQTTTEPIPLPLPAGYTRHSLGTLLRALIPNEHARGWLMRAGLTWTMAFGDALLELVGADSTQDAPNRNQQNSTGVA